MMEQLVPFLQRRGSNPRGKIPSDLPITDVTEVSSECRAGSIFVAIKGFKTDGHRYIEDAAWRGARIAVVTDLPVPVPSGMSIVRVDDTRNIAGPLAQWVYGDPSGKMDVVGVTGTNGKTTSVFLMEAIFRATGRNPGIMGTVVNRWAGKQEVAQETTPSGPKIARQLATMLKDGVDSVAFEVSSHAIDQRRVDGIRFRAMALTNVTQDHLDYHKTMEEYAAVKMSIFDRMRDENPDAVGVVNVDDETGRKLAAKLPAKNRLTYAVENKEADLRAETIEFRDDGMDLILNFQGHRHPIATPMHGTFNAMNCLTATGLSLALGLDWKGITEGCRIFRGAPGRFEVIGGLPGVKVVVDYAHTPDALTKLLQNARRSLTRNRLIAVFGCGGDRDKTKRPLMGATAAQLADELFITSDNPRTEVPEQILDQIVAGIPKSGSVSSQHVHVIEDRRDAIESAIRSAKEGDAVVIAGKGHEDYQIVGTTKHHFDDREVAKEMIRRRIE